MGSLGMWSGIKPSKQTPQSKAPSASRDQHCDQKTLEDKAFNQTLEKRICFRLSDDDSIRV